MTSLKSLDLSMTIREAVSFIRPGINPIRGTWADIGAGTGVFSEALMQILEEGKVIAFDKSPHVLYSIKPPPHIQFEIREGDFHDPLQLPPLDGVLMANALHYAPDHIAVLKNVLSSLKEGASFLLIEYDTEIPNHPWVPYPVSLNRFRQLCTEVGLHDPEVIGRRESIYQDGKIYAALTKV